MQENHVEPWHWEYFKSVNLRTKLIPVKHLTALSVREHNRMLGLREDKNTTELDSYLELGHVDSSERMVLFAQFSSVFHEPKTWNRVGGQMLAIYVLRFVPNDVVQKILTIFPWVSTRELGPFFGAREPAMDNPERLRWMVLHSRSMNLVMLVQLHNGSEEGHERD
jgi:hypothetical protein